MLGGECRDVYVLWSDAGWTLAVVYAGLDATSGTSNYGVVRPLAYLQIRFLALDTVQQLNAARFFVDLMQPKWLRNWYFSFK